MSEYSENIGSGKSKGKDRESGKPSNQEQEKDYFGEKPGKLDNLISETDNKENRTLKNDYFGEKPEKLDKILADDTKDRNTEQKLDYFGKSPKDLDKILDTTHSEKHIDKKLEDFSKKPPNEIMNNKIEKKPAPQFSSEKSPPKAFDPDRPITIWRFWPGRKWRKVKRYSDGTEVDIPNSIQDSTYKMRNKPNNKSKPNYVKNEKNPSNSNLKNAQNPKNSSPQQNPFSATSTNKIFGKDAPTFKLKNNPIPESEPYRINKPSLKKSSQKQKPVSTPSPNKLLGKGDPTFILKKDSFLKDELNTAHKPNPKNKPNPDIDYLKIPIVKNPDILGKILKNPPENITDKANETNQTGRMYYMKNEVTQKRYIGQTTLTIKERLKDHFKEAKYKKDNTHLNNSIRKHGRENFTIHEFQKIENQKQWALDGLETHYIAKYHTQDPRYGYNIAPGGKGGKHSPETLEKIKQSNIKAKAHMKGIPLSKEHRQKISKGLTGLKKTEATKQKISQSHKGMKTSEETKRLLSEINTGENHPFFGKKHSKSTIKKMSDGKMGEKNPFHGKHHTVASRRLMSEANKGIPNTPEQKRKIRETKIQNFKDENPIDELAFKNAVRNGATTKEISEEFKLRRSAVSTWLGHLYGTSKITEARERAEYQ